MSLRGGSVAGPAGAAAAQQQQHARPPHHGGAATGPAAQEAQAPQQPLPGGGRRSSGSSGRGSQDTAGSSDARIIAEEARDAPEGGLLELKELRARLAAGRAAAFFTRATPPATPRSGAAAEEPDQASASPPLPAAGSGGKGIVQDGLCALERAAATSSPFSSFFAVLEDDDDGGEDGDPLAASLRRPPLPAEQLKAAYSTPAQLALSRAEVRLHGREGGPSAGDAHVPRASMHVRKPLPQQQQQQQQGAGRRGGAQSLPEPEALLAQRLAARAAAQKPGAKSLDAHAVLREALRQQERPRGADSSEAQQQLQQPSTDHSIVHLGRQ
jgi:hypothetical protein